MDEYNALWTDLAELNDSKNLIWAYQNIPSIIKWQLSISVCIRFSFVLFEKIVYLRNNLTKIILLFCIRNVSNIWIRYKKRRSFCIKYSSVQVLFLQFLLISFYIALNWMQFDQTWNCCWWIVFTRNLLYIKNTIIMIQLSRSCVLHLQFLQRRFHPLLRRLQ